MMQSTSEWNKIRQLSVRAIDLCYHSPERDLPKLAALLYFYNRLPVTKKWRELIPDEEAALRFVGLKPDQEWAARHGLEQTTNHALRTNPYWSFWEVAHSHSSNFGRRSFKLYISPMPEDLASLVGLVIDLVGVSGAHALKIGKTAEGLLRPDKLMIYFSNLEDTIEFAEKILGNAVIHHSQGVPFTYPVGDSGLLSIGFDPPASVSWESRPEGESWRLWVTNIIAAAILKAKRSRSSDHMAGIMKAIEAAGVDPIWWRPVESDWQ